MTSHFPPFDEVLGSSQRFLLAVANELLPADLRAKGGASDLVQQTLAAAIRSEHQFRGETVGELRAWLRSILQAETAAFCRRYSGTASRDVRRERQLGTSDNQDTWTPECAALKAEQTQRLAAAVEQLPADFRQAVALRLEDGLSFAEIGVRLGRSEEAARKLYSRALDRLRNRITDVAEHVT
jgi:RNA polymerase sigma-70 factor (ECF subfamily)